MINIKHTFMVSALSLGLVVSAVGLAGAATSNSTDYTAAHSVTTPAVNQDTVTATTATQKANMTVTTAAQKANMTATPVAQKANMTATPAAQKATMTATPMSSR